MPLLKSSVGLTALLAPHVQSPLGPVCLTCGRVVDEEQLVEGYPGESTFAKVLVRHHGAEELRTFDMGSSNWDERDLGQMMRHVNWFDPASFEGAGLGQKVKPNYVDDPEPTKLITGGGS